MRGFSRLILKKDYKDIYDEKAKIKKFNNKNDLMSIISKFNYKNKILINLCHWTRITGSIDNSPFHFIRELVKVLAISGNADHKIRVFFGMFISIQ